MLGPDELEQVFRLAASTAHDLFCWARVCREWRSGASAVRRDVAWQIDHLRCINGVPEALLLPLSAEGLRRWVVERPFEALHFMSIGELRSAGADEALVTRRLDFDDGLVFHVTTVPPPLRTSPARPPPSRRHRLAAAISKSDVDEAEHMREARRAALRSVCSGDKGDWVVHGGDNYRIQLPVPCTLERDKRAASALRVLVGEHHIGWVPADFESLVQAGEGRLVSLGYINGYWKVRALPRIASPCASMPAVAPVATPARVPTTAAAHGEAAEPEEEGGAAPHRDRLGASARGGHAERRHRRRTACRQAQLDAARGPPQEAE